MIKKLKKLLWFLKRPRFYSHLIHLVFKKLSPASYKRDNTEQEASQWCAGLAVDTNTALEQLTGRPAQNTTQTARLWKSSAAHLFY